MTENYATLYAHFAINNDFIPFLSLMFLFLGRMLPIITLVPFFGARVLPQPIKMAFAFSLFAIFLPQLVMLVKTPLAFNFLLFLYLAKELVTGLLIGFILSLPFMIVQNAGILIDHQRGGASLMVNDPTIQNQSSPLGTLFNLILIYLFFMIDGPFTVIDIVAQSYLILPPDKFFDPAFFNPNSPIFTNIIGILGQVMILSTQLAAPALIMILMTDFFLGIANRLAPQVQITFLGMPLKSLLALFIVFMGWELFNEEILKQTYQALKEVSLLINRFAPMSMGTQAA